MKNLLLIVLLFSLKASSQVTFPPYVPTNPDSIRFLGNVGGAPRMISGADITKKKLNIADTVGKWTPLTNTITVNGATLPLSSNPNFTVNTTATDKTVTEQRNYYRGEFVIGRTINTTTGAVTVSGTDNTTDFIHVNGGESITISAPLGYPAITVYGWTYDTSLTAISEIRSSSLIGTKVSSYTFTTPTNARFLNVYVKYAEQDFTKTLQIKSTNTYTYKVPITPEQFSGTKSAPIQAALDFARYTSNGVELKGNYTIDSSLILSSGSTLILNNARLTLDSASKTNVIRNEAVANPLQIFARGNRNIKIIGIGNAIIEGSKASWGGSGPAGIGTQYWRPISTLFANVQNFEIAGITFKNTNMWAFCAEQSRIGVIRDINIIQDSSKQNQDGINIRRGSNKITVENIRGLCWDDIVAMTNIVGYPEYDILGNTIYEPYSTNLDIHSVIVKNIQRDTSGTFNGINPPFYKNGILLLCAGGLKLHDVTVDGVTGSQQIQVGYTGYGTSSTVNDMYNIVVQNTNAAQVNFLRPVKNSSFINIPSLDVTGAASGLFLDGSLKVLRKYYNGNFEFFDSTYTGANSTFATTPGLNNFTGTNNFYGTTNFLSTVTAPTLTGGVAASGNLTLSTTTNATKGKIFLGASSAYDDVNKRLGINTTTPAYKLDISTSTGNDGVTVTQTDIASAGAVSVLSGTSTAYLKAYGQNFSIANLAGAGGFGSSGNAFMFSSGSNSNGGAGVSLIYGGGYSSERIRASTSGVYINKGTGAGINATAALHLPAGTIAAGTAPLKITTTSAALMTTPEAGAFETDGTDLYWTNSSGVRKKVTLQ